MGFPKPTAPFAKLAKDARDGDQDAALLLAKRAPDQGFELWFKRWVPRDERGDVLLFDVFRDAYARMEMDRLDAQCKDIEVEEA